jgi:hypothetical protein
MQKAKKFAPKTTSRQQSIFKAKLKLYVFSLKLIFKCVMNDDSYFTAKGIEFQQKIHCESEDHPTKEILKFIRNTKFSANVLLWQAYISEYGCTM